MPDAELWTIDRLCDLVATELLASDPSQPSARVRAVPDRRTIRWYTTIGLLDRPAEMRGRTALYGRRHLLQIVAIKRLQATGIPLAEIQARLAGATNGMLARLAELPDAPVAAAPRGRTARVLPHALRGPARPAGTAAAGTGAERLTASASAEHTDDQTGADGDRGRFWAAAAFPEQPGYAGPAGHAEPAVQAAMPTAHDHDIALLPAIKLTDGVTLTLSAAGRLPDAADVAAIRQAAGPLLDLLQASGLDAPHNIWEDR
jgi:DNA-binding transcriptional MerR regulator